MNYWLVKTEPETYGFEDLVRDGRGCWDGVRNVEARDNLRRMAVDDAVLVYHSGKTREIVGIAKVVRSAYRDPSSNRAIWSAVDLEPVAPLPRAVTLAQVKAEPEFEQCALVRRSRLSVMPISEAHFQRMLEMGGMGAA